MLELTAAQIEQLQADETAAFVERVAADLVEQFPELGSDERLLERLNIAHAAALVFGLENTAARVQFLYYEAFAPHFYEHPAISAWLTKPGNPVEQRWRDLAARLNSLTRED